MTTDLLLRGARLGPDALSDILIRDGVVARVAPAGSVRERAEVVDLDGRIAMPGLWDGHVHFTQAAIQRSRFDLSGARSAADALAIVRRIVAGRAPRPDEVLVGYGFRDALWPDEPSQRALDEAGSGAALVLVSGDLHTGWISSAAAERLGRHPDATGLLKEGAWIGTLDSVEGLSEPSIADYRETAEQAASRGVVGIIEYEGADNLREWPERVAAGVDSLRVVASMWPHRLEAAIAAGHRTGQVLDEAGLVTVGPLKIVVDGSLNTRTALCWDPYPRAGGDGADPDAADAYGVESVDPGTLRALIERAVGAGIGLAIHAIGDRANTVVLDEFERARARGAIEHAQLLRDEDLPRFARLGVVASVQPEHALDDRDVADRIWAGRTDRAFAFGSLHAAGAELRLGSDAPVAPLDPWRAIAAAVARTGDDREPWHPEQRLPLDVAIAASTMGRDAIREGDPADIAVLDDDPRTASIERLRALPVAATLLAGRRTWWRL
ncbi:amidohydrolase [Microbacterium marinilacus]|uniref:Amidohydrolase family protein n=1 Tax=Microbacterium marinilacus TaxID=415209 RepID=A0ABP7BRD2_9MICO|nr:amidohydrolase family protein [Microbacterium marinilacus]MBY0690242.1 amidohydrolase family protein [Microbacterium marinilacus]